MTRRKRARLTSAAIASLMLAVAPWAMAANVPAGVGGDPTTGPFEADPNGMIKVDNGDGGPVPIFIDPSAPGWAKSFIIPGGTPLEPEQQFGVWEEILLLPPPPTTGEIPPLPITDWHEKIHPDPINPPFIWSGGVLVIHDPLDPNAPPLVEVPGMVSEDGLEIWFGPFPGLNPLDYPNGLPIWIHKELIYAGSQPLPDIPTTLIQVWEHPTVPEPGTALLAMAGAIGFALATSRRRQRS